MLKLNCYLRVIPSDIHCYTDFQKGCYQVTPEGKWGRTIRAWICRKYLVAIFLFKNNNAFLFWTHRNGYAFFMCVCVCARSCLTLCNPMDCSPPDSSVHGIFQARILVWVAISFSRRSSWPRDRICVSCISCIGRWILYHWATWELLRTNH